MNPSVTILLPGVEPQTFGRTDRIAFCNDQLSIIVYIENNTWTRRDMEFIFECSHRYRTSERSELVRYRM